MQVKITDSITFYEGKIGTIVDTTIFADAVVHQIELPSGVPGGTITIAVRDENVEPV